MIKKAWKWHTDFIREHPVFSAYVAWIEGIIVGVFLAWLIPGNIFNIFN